MCPNGLTQIKIIIEAYENKTYKLPPLAANLDRFHNYLTIALE